MAKSSTSMLSFFAVLLALLKHVAGMRAGPTQTASMVETEPWWGKDPCAQFGAEKKSWWQPNICQCPKELPLPRNCEGRSDHTFDLKKTIEEGSSDCHCEDPCEKFGAEPRGDWCICPKELPVSSRNCLGTSVRGRDGRDYFRPSKPTQGCRCVTEVEAREPEEDPCAQFSAKERPQKSNICQCPKELPLPRNCEGRSDHTFDLKKTIEEGSSDCHCEDPCEKFGAEPRGDWCICPKELPVSSRNCLGTSVRGRDGRDYFRPSKPTQGCRCVTEVEAREPEEDPCAQFSAKERPQKSNICQCPKELPLPRNCEGRSSDRTFDLLMAIKKGSNCRCEEIPSCEKFGAKNIREDRCHCPSDGSIQTKECRGNLHDFHPSDASEGCRCLSQVEAVELRKMPVAASALRFCDALVEQSYTKSVEEDGLTSAIHNRLEKTSLEVCQHSLTGTITPQEAKEAPFAEKASELSREGSDENRNGDRAYGRMRAVKEDATTSPTEKALWERALAQVCKDECEDLLQMMYKEANHQLAHDVLYDHVPFAQACAEHVVQQVEAEVLGCCGRSCGFDGRRCLLWPFFSPQEKVEWEVECCAEMSILKNSSRELMCNSVLLDRLAKEASQYDLNEQAGADIGKVLLGQNSSLVWTQEGAQESALGKEAKAHGGEKVSMEFLIKHQKIGEEYLRLGYFKEKPLSKMLDEATSLMEVSSQDATCDFGKFKEKCPPQWMDTYTNRCKEAWMVADEKKRFFRDQLTRGKGGDCSVNDHIEVAAPADCDELANNQKIILHYFEYNKENSKKPIKCFTLSKEQCKGEAGWWTKIPLKSVQDVIKEEEIKNYTHLVYVKLKAD